MIAKKKNIRISQTFCQKTQAFTKVILRIFDYSHLLNIEFDITVHYNFDFKRDKTISIKILIISGFATTYVCSGF